MNRLSKLPGVAITRQTLVSLLRPVDELQRWACTSPLLANSPLSTVADELAPTGVAAELYDSDWRLLWVSAELQTLLGTNNPDELGLGAHVLEVYAKPHWRAVTSPEQRERSLQEGLPHLLSETPGGITALQTLLDPAEHPLLDGITAEPPPWVSTQSLAFHQGELPPITIWSQTIRLRDDRGQLVGALRSYSPALPASLLALVARGDEAMFARQQRLFEPGRRATAMMFADLENSTALARTLSSAMYFRLISAVLRAVDDAVVAEHGIIGKHVGDGASAFFPQDEFASTSRTARAALQAARRISAAITELEAAFNQELEQPISLAINIGIHWGDTVYIGQIITGGRLEVTAIGDEVNAAARIETAAAGGVILASKALLEQLDDTDAAELQLTIHRLRFRPLGQWPSVPQASKTQRDAARLPVTQISI
jgi:class 3 adenylate cyclase